MLRRITVTILGTLLIAGSIQANPIFSLLLRGTSSNLAAVFKKVGFKETAGEAAQKLDEMTKIIMKSKAGWKEGDQIERELVESNFFNNKKIDAILLKDESKVTSEEMIALVNMMSLAADSRISGTVCSSCVSKNLRALGVVNITIELPKKMQKHLNKVTGKSSVEIEKLVKEKAIKLGIARDDRRELLSKTPKEQYKTLFVVFDLMEHGTPEQINLGDSIKKLLTVGERTDYSKSKIYNLMYQDMTDPEIKMWTARLDAIRKEPKMVDPAEGYISNLRKHLEDGAKEDPELEVHLKYLQDNGCFGIFPKR